MLSKEKLATREMFLKNARKFNILKSARFLASGASEGASEGASLLSPLFKAALNDTSATAAKDSPLLATSTSRSHTGAAMKPLPNRFIFTTGNMRVSQKKLNHLARVIKGMSLDEAQSQMRMSIKKRGKDVTAMIQRAASALVHNWGFPSSTVRKDFFIKQAWIGKGVFLKRIRIHGRGRTGKMTRPYAHLKVLLGNKEPAIVATSTDIDPLTGQVYTPSRILAKQEEFAKLVKIFKRDRLFLTLKDAKPVYAGTAPWSGKGWKYITSPKWIDPSNALMNSKKPPKQSSKA